MVGVEEGAERLTTSEPVSVLSGTPFLQSMGIYLCA